MRSGGAFFRSISGYSPWLERALTGVSDSVESDIPIEPARGPLQDAPVANDEWPAALVDIRMGECFQDDFRTDSSRVTHRDC